MRRPFRYALYFVIGMIIYQIVDSDGSSFTHEEVKKTLLIAIIVIFILLLIVRVIKQRHE